MVTALEVNILSAHLLRVNCVLIYSNTMALPTVVGVFVFVFVFMFVLCVPLVVPVLVLVLLAVASIWCAWMVML